MKFLTLLFAFSLPLAAQDIFTTGTPATGANVTTSDMIQFRDVSVTSGAGTVKPLQIGQLVDVPGFFTNLDDASIPVAKITGLGTAATAGATSFSDVPMTARFVLEGDSITNPNLIAYPTFSSWVTYASTMSNFIGRGTISNVAVSGSTYLSMTGRYASNVYPLRPTGGEKVFLFTMIGSNDGGTDSSTWIAALETYWTTAKADGFTVVAVTTPIYTANTNTLNFAAAVRGSAVPDIIVDLGPVFKNSTNTNLWLGDGLHPAVRGSKLIADTVNLALNRSQANPGQQSVTVAGNGVGVGEVNPRASFHGISATSGVQLLIGDSSVAKTPSSGAWTGYTVATMPFTANAASPIGIFGGANRESSNDLYIGRGGPSSYVGATTVGFYAASTVSETGGRRAGAYTVANTGLATWTFDGTAMFQAPSQSGGGIYMVPSATSSYLRISPTGGVTLKQGANFGVDVSGGTLATGNSANDTVLNAMAGGRLVLATAAGGSNQASRIAIKTSGVLNFITAPTTYADNAAALVGGLVAGDVYKTSTGQLMIVY